jgi:Ca-activated chloride channel homolog
MSRPTVSIALRMDLLDLLGRFRGDRAALVLFRHKALLACPLTTDRAFLEQALYAAQPDSAPPGETSLGAGIRAALDAFDSADMAHKAIILVSDGEDLTGDALAAAASAASRGVPIFTIGFGSTSGSPVPARDPGTFAEEGGKPVISRLDHATLRDIAAATGGAYVPIGTTHADLGDIYARHLARGSRPRHG